MHGHERCPKSWSNDNDELHAWMYAIKCENPGRISVTFEQKLETIERSLFLSRPMVKHFLAMSHVPEALKLCSELMEFICCKLKGGYST